MYDLRIRLRYRRGLPALALLATLMAFPATGLTTTPGPPNVEVVPPVVIHTERGDEPVEFVPGQITFIFTDGSTSECVIDPAAPPSPCSELMTNPGPPDVDITPPSPIFGEDGGVVGFEPGLILITFDDGSQRSCVIDPALPPNPCTEGVR